MNETIQPETADRENNGLEAKDNSAVENGRGKRKKVVLFYTSISALVENRETAIEKLKNVFALFKENKDDILLYYHPDPAIFKFLEEKDNELFNEYIGVVNQFIEEDYGVYDDGEDDTFMVRLCDAYYGDNGYVMYHCMRAKKPVMVMNYECL